MLFDLRSRGRRRTVQVIYIGLAVLIGAGLILFGVGTGSSGGGLFGAFTGSNSSGGGADHASTAQIKSALAQVKKSPNSAAAWANLVNARYSAADAGFNTNTNTYTAAGKVQLQYVAQAYTRYAKLTSTPSVNVQTLVARAYTQLSNWSASSAVYQSMVTTDPATAIHSLECVALTSYAAKDDRVAELAQAQVLAKVPKTSRAEIKSVLEQAKTSTSGVTDTC